VNAWVERSMRAAVSLPPKGVSDTDSDALRLLTIGLADVGAMAVWSTLEIVAGAGTAVAVGAMSREPESKRTAALAIGGAAIAFTGMGLFIHVARATCAVRLGSRFVRRTGSSKTRRVIRRLCTPTPLDFALMTAAALLMWTAIARWRAFS
jgi:hypothetical protein